MSSDAFESRVAPEPGLAAVQGPLVRLVDASHVPYDLSIATARTCYSGKGIVWPEQVSATEKDRALRDKIAASTLKAGHLTTRQHPHFIFAIDRVSRHLVWSFLHSHPFYNSEQVSQRYVEVKAEQFYVPSSLGTPGRSNLKEIYLDAVRYATAAYFDLTRELEDPAAGEFFNLFPARRSRADKWTRAIHRRSMETARYVLPVSTYTYLYHTISGLTLHRYRRLCTAFDVPVETKLLVDAMFHAVRDWDPMYAGEMPDPVALEDTTEYKFFQGFFASDARARTQSSVAFVREFDAELGGRISRLCGSVAGAQGVLAASVRAVFGVPKSVLSDVEAVALVLDPAKNSHLASTLNETTMSRITRSLYNVQYTFQKKISHTADSQDQRHRMVPGSRPVLMSHYTGRADYIVPVLIASDPGVSAHYEEVMNGLFERIARFRDAGGTEEEAVYLLPNAFPVRFYESGDLLNLHHKWKSRTCYNAQEEIFRASVEEVVQVSQAHPDIGRWIKAPCWLRKRAGTKPFCPEGDHYCGVAVWNLEIEEYERVL